jgi:hypothetical protein
MDYEKLAAACGMTNPRSASNAWSAIKKKLFANVPAPNAKDGKAPKTPKTPGSARKRKAKVVDDAPATSGAEKAEDDDDEEAAATPVKKRVRAKPKPKAKAPVKAVKNEVDSDEEDKVHIEAKFAVKKPKAATKAEPNSDESDDDGAEAAEGADMVPVHVVADLEGEV